ncbi:MAG: septum formation protein Maf [Bdellovibrionales bacterium RIFOXYD1_FULL_53_11]|nr:MAG: septum formation protein Maf [Bdellovibrionales bacterium RIFOXYD1_FULL_53_11]
MSLVLASTSPRRIELLKNAGFDFVLAKPDADESRRRGESPKAMALRLAQLKAMSVAALFSNDRKTAIILSADTIVVAPDGKTVLGKPRNARDAARMLKLLSGRTHTVITAYCLVSSNSRRKLTRAVSTRVTFRPLSGREISSYIKTREPMDKAGAYAAQNAGMTIIKSIRGSYTNVVGLPVAEVLSDLRRAGLK